MFYKYNDDFIINSLEDDEIQKLEDDAILHVGKLNVVDTLYIERLVIARVYIKACLLQLEADGMNDKLKAYRVEYKDALNESLLLDKDGVHNKDTVFTVSIGRS